MGFGERMRMRMCVLAVPCLGRVLFKKVAVIMDIAVELLCERVRVYGGAATVDGDHKTPRVHDLEC